MHKGLKLSISLEMPKEQEHKTGLNEKIEDCMERVEYGDDPAAYKFLERTIKCATHCHKAGKRSDKLHKLLGLLTPFMSRLGMEGGVDLVDEYVTNPDYKENPDESE